MITFIVLALASCCYCPGNARRHENLRIEYEDDWRYFRRRTLNIFNLTGSVVATIFGLVWLFWILWTTLSYGFAAFDWTLFTQNTPRRAAVAARQFIVGSLIMVGWQRHRHADRVLPVPTSRVRQSTSWAAASISSTIFCCRLPSIIVGLFVYELW